MVDFLEIPRHRSRPEMLAGQAGGEFDSMSKAEEKFNQEPQRAAAMVLPVVVRASTKPPARHVLRARPKISSAP